MGEQGDAGARWPPWELIEKIRLQGISADSPDGGPPAVVSLEDYFSGNDDYGSFAANVTLPPPPAPPGIWGKVRRLLRPAPGGLPAPRAFYELFKRVRDRDEVQDVLVEIRELEEEADGRLQPYSDTVYVFARASKEEVARWLEGPLHPDEVIEGYGEEKPPAAPELDDGVKVFAAWWD
jgi:hypothetical protein